MVIAVRGSGESPQANWTDPAAYSADPNRGAGEVNYDVYKALVASNPNLHFALDPVMYPAVAVPDLVTATANYRASVQSGTTVVLDDIARTERVCGGGVKYLFLGYSQGAWVVHRVVHAMGPKLLGKVTGVGLTGDPEFIPFQKIVRDYKLRDIAFGSAAAVDAVNTGVPKSIADVTGSWCFPKDPVCQTVLATGAIRNADSLVTCARGDSQCPHFRYVTDGETKKEADFLDANLPSQSVWPTLTRPRPPAGTVGSAYNWTATAKPTARTSYTWSSVGTLPPGLTFSTGGALSGTPTKAGTYSFAVTATSAQQRTVTGPVNVTINSPGPLTITTTALPDATVGTSYKQILTGSGGSLPYTWKATGTALSVGLTFDSATATISGTPTKTGQFSLNVQLTDAVRGTAVATFNVTVNPGAPPPPTTGTWTPVELALTAPADHGIANGVSCATAANCTAVGFDCCTTFTSAGAVARPLAQTLANGAWTSANPPLPPDAGPYYTASLSAVACLSATACVAAGTYWDGSTRDSVQRPLLETLNAGTWTPTSPPLPAGAGTGYGVLSGVSCASTTACIAVGWYFDTAAARARPFVETLTGGVWSPTILPLPVGAFDARLDSASCVSPTACAAVGSYTAADGSLQPLMETLAGSVWTPTSLPLPAGGRALYRSGGVSCPSAATCIAAGNYFTATDDVRPFAATLASGIWTSASLPLPAGAGLGGEVLGVSCATLAVCTAVGYVDDLPLVETWANGEWTPASLPLPADATGGSLYGVSCVFAIACTASGEHHSIAHPYGRPMVESKAP